MDWRTISDRWIAISPTKPRMSLPSIWGPEDAHFHLWSPISRLGCGSYRLPPESDGTVVDRVYVLHSTKITVYQAVQPPMVYRVVNAADNWPQPPPRGTWMRSTVTIGNHSRVDQSQYISARWRFGFRLRNPGGDFLHFADPGQRARSGRSRGLPFLRSSRDQPRE